ncbi:tyrosine-type recombinase/integrase [Sandarakinorhabdus rubra]|uniref:tyrosine-type recombinase/integrase n=1 Tax=Sandarakinorhabdus rubra TaxID=2672568 RepID=UPI0013D9520F|nr:tyrosine-type recombinase/integrase [Sandarakinorhabdus rubra]
MAIDLSKVEQRDKLKARPAPYWHRLRAGCFVGYRPSKVGGKGHWLARVYDAETCRYKVKALGDFGTLAGKEQFAAAKTEAEAIAALVESGGEVRPKIVTVADACRAYAETRAEAEGRFKRFVYGDAVAGVKLAKLRRQHLKDWRKRLAETPAQVSRRKTGEIRHRSRAPSTVNRELAALRAALRAVLPLGAPGTEAAWQEALKPAKNADGQRIMKLSRDERRKLLDHIDAEAAPFLKGLCLLPLRPGALAALTVADFNKHSLELTIGKDKTGKPRTIVIPAVAAALMTEQAKDKLPGAPLFMRANGKAWNRNSWKLPIAEAAKAAGLPKGVTAYTMRHSVITDLVTNGLPLLTIAQISGTSVEMIEKHYGHLDKEAAKKALAELAL